MSFTNSKESIEYERIWTALAKDNEPPKRDYSKDMINPEHIQDLFEIGMLRVGQTFQMHGEVFRIHEIDIDFCPSHRETRVRVSSRSIHVEGPCMIGETGSQMFRPSRREYFHEFYVRR